MTVMNTQETKVSILATAVYCLVVEMEGKDLPQLQALFRETKRKYHSVNLGYGSMRNLLCAVGTLLLPYFEGDLTWESVQDMMDQLSDVAKEATA